MLFTSPYELRKLLDNDLFQHLRFLYCSHQVSSDAHYIAAILRYLPNIPFSTNNLLLYLYSSNYLPQSYMSICHFSGLNAEWTSLNNAPHLDTICGEINLFPSPPPPSLIADVFFFYSFPQTILARNSGVLTHRQEEYMVYPTTSSTLLHKRPN